MEFSSLLSQYPYADIRIHHGTDTSIKINNNEVTVVSGNFYGMSVRVLKNGSWGFASSNMTISPELLLEKANRLASLQDGSITLQETKQDKKTIENKIKFLSIEDKITSLFDAKKEMNGKYLIGTTISCSDTFVTKELYSSEGVELIQESSYTYLSCSGIAKSGELIQRGYETQATTHGFSALDPHTIARVADQKAEKLLTALPPVKGRFTVVLDPEMTGVFSHEALGHASEADSIVDRESILSGKLQTKIGNELVTIVDDPTADDFGFYHYDDEGVKAQKAELVTNGILMNYLNSRETSSKLQLKLNGHARAGGFDQIPIVRMSNTYFGKGKTQKSDLFDLKQGVYLKGMKRGSVDIFSGGFMFKAEEAHEIKNGELGTLLRDVTLSGNILETLNNVTLVGNDFGTSPGICGKMGQSAPVSDGGPHIQVKDMLVG